VITVRKEDIKGLANIVFKPGFMAYLLKNMHWVLKFLFERIFRQDRFSHPEEQIEIIRE
jgi:hypothetical protein